MIEHYPEKQKESAHSRSNPKPRSTKNNKCKTQALDRSNPRAAALCSGVMVGRMRLMTSRGSFASGASPSSSSSLSSFSSSDDDGSELSEFSAFLFVPFALAFSFAFDLLTGHSLFGLGGSGSFGSSAAGLVPLSIAAPAPLQDFVEAVDWTSFVSVCS